MQIAKCKSQNVGKRRYGLRHTSILQFEIFNLHFALAAAKGRAMVVQNSLVSQ